jgi:DNA topoisomerase-3
VVQENYRKFQCQKCAFSLWKVLSGREWAPEEIADLFTRRFIGPLTGFRSRIGKPFAAGIRLSNDLRLEFDFGRGAGSADGEDAPDFSAQEPLGTCPKCRARVFEHGAAYVCEKAVSAERTCDFRSGKIILQQPIERAQMQKLLATGRTDLLSGFVSRRNGRKFKAFLVARPDGKVAFEFEARAPRQKTVQPLLKGQQAAQQVPKPVPPARAKPSRRPATARRIKTSGKARRKVA